MWRRLAFLFAVVFVAYPSPAQAARPRLPLEVIQALNAPESITLYSLDPNPRAFHWWFVRRLHDFRIIGQVPVTDLAQRRRVAETVQRTAETYTFDTKCVFSPRHAVRLTSGSRTYDILICFECLQMEVYSGDRTLAEFSVAGSPDVLNAILRSAHIRIAD